MKKQTVIWLMIAAFLVLTGCIIFGGVMSMLGWDFAKLSTVSYETNEYAIGESFQNISIDTNIASITFVPSNNEAVTVICHEQASYKHTVGVTDGVLTIRGKDSRKWYEHIGISFGTPKITVSLPQGQYGALTVKSDTGTTSIPGEFLFESMDITQTTGSVKTSATALQWVNIQTSTGSIHVENASMDALDLRVTTGKVTVSGVSCAGEASVKVSTGKAELTNLSCDTLTSTGSTGSLLLTNVVAANTVSIQRSTGSIHLDRCDAAALSIETDTGNISGTLLSQKVFIAHSDTGHVDVPKSITGGQCQLSTDTGDIDIDVIE